MASRRAAVAVCALVIATVAGTPGAVALPPQPITRDAGAGFGFLAECGAHRDDSVKFRCYVRGLLRDVEASRNPAREVPWIDGQAKQTGGYLAANCHSLMHVVGRQFGRRHGLTLATLQRYIPRSNDPNCSAGFGMGLVMYLGPQIVRFGGRGADATCKRLPTRFRRYACVHGLGHAYMRAFHGDLVSSLRACRSLGFRNAQDCAQGVFHDYWISLNGQDGTTKRRRAYKDARTLCAQQMPGFVAPCWYRFFLERPPKSEVRLARQIDRLCVDLRGNQRSGCVAAASLVASSDPFEQARVCSRLPASDAVACLHGVQVPAVAGRRQAQLALIRMCGRMTPDARRGCYEWFGKTLAVVTDGAFRVRGCPKLDRRNAREACVHGARRMHNPLVTFA